MAPQLRQHHAERKSWPASSVLYHQGPPCNIECMALPGFDDSTPRPHLGQLIVFLDTMDYVVVLGPDCFAIAR
jgi:hypothetical protein